MIYKDLRHIHQTQDIVTFSKLLVVITSLILACLLYHCSVHLDRNLTSQHTTERVVDTLCHSLLPSAVWYHLEMCEYFTLIIYLHQYVDCSPFVVDLFKNQLSLPSNFFLDLSSSPSLMSLLVFVTQWFKLKFS